MHRQRRRGERFIDAIFFWQRRRGERAFLDDVSDAKALLAEIEGKA